MSRILTFIMLTMAVTAAPATGAGDADRGRALYERRCVACHSLDHHRVGPAHRGVVGRVAGTAAGYVYSPALQAPRIVWTEATLERWLAEPERLVPGQKMGYSVGEADDRRDLIAYLRSVSP